jgi:hypothetical protein
MRLNSLALLALAPATSLAFAPMNNNAVVRPSTSSTASSSSSLSLKNADNNVEQMKKGFASIFAASTIFIAASVGQPNMLIEPAFAASTPTTSTATTSKKVVDPLATEKAAVDTAKSQLAAASAEVAKTKKTLGDANASYAKATDAVVAGEKKAIASKKALITANDKLADAKAKESKNGGDLSLMKEVEGLGSKVGTCLFCA